MARIDDILDREWLTNNGPYVQELEQKIAEYLGVKHCVAMCNGTVALEIASRALGFKGEVIAPSFTFIATAHALQWQEITPVFCDVAPGSYHLDPTQIEKMITPNTSGIVGVHVWGQACDVEAIGEIAQRHNLRVLYDAAHAFGCSHRGQMIGGFGDAEVFSFHATKFFNTFEGGAITTNNDHLAQQVRFMRNFGFAGYDDVQYLGTNGKMSEVSAAMGLTLFEDLDDIVETNHRHYRQYQELLADFPGVQLFAYDESERCNYQYIVLEIDEETTGISRDTLVKVLHVENVLARRYFYPGCHQMEPYCSYFPHAGLLLPNTNRLTQRVMALPTGMAVSDENIDQICGLIRFIIKYGTEISQLA
jgi:dTDP-4-amino-4,6-dideoxygalactose transaminase